MWNKQNENPAPQDKLVVVERSGTRTTALVTGNKVEERDSWRHLHFPNSFMDNIEVY